MMSPLRTQRNGVTLGHAVSLVSEKIQTGKSAQVRLYLCRFLVSLFLLACIQNVKIDIVR